jgi:hypothetical protein
MRANFLKILGVGGYGSPNLSFVDELGVGVARATEMLRIERHSLKSPGVLPEISAGSCYGRASKIKLNGVCVARRKWENPPDVTTSLNRFSPACAPSARPTSCDSEAGVQSSVDAP